MPQGTTEMAKRLIEHLIGTLLHVWRLVARVAVIAGVGTALLTEIVAGITTRQFPSGPTHLVAAALGIAVAYGAAATVLVGEIFQGLLHTLHVLEGDAAAGATAAAALAAHEARAARNELDLLLGRAPTPKDQPAVVLPQPHAARPPAPARPLATPPPPRPASGGVPVPAPRTDPLRVEAFAAELPAQLPPLPVRADRLPRIEWANTDAPTIPPSLPTSSPEPATPAAGPSARSPEHEAPGGPTLTELGLTGVALAAGGIALREHMRMAPSAPVVTAPSEAETPSSADTVPPVSSRPAASAEPATIPFPPMGERAGERSETPAETAMPLPSLPSAERGTEGAGESLAESAAPPVPSLLGGAERDESPAETAMPLSPLSAIGAEEISESPAKTADIVPPAVVPTLTIPAISAVAPAPEPVWAPRHEPLQEGPLEGGEEDTPLVPPPAMVISQPMAPISQPLIEPPAFAVPAENPGAEGSIPPVAPTPDAPAAEAPPPVAAPRPSGQVTRPLSRPLAPITGPLAPTTDPLTSPSGSGNLWDRLSQALMGIPPVDPSGAADGAETLPSGPLETPEQG